MRYMILSSALLLFILVLGASGQSAVDQTTLPTTYVPSGGAMYKEYCAACHGATAKGNGPAAAYLKTPPPDLTTLAKRHLGKFPYDYVASILRFGPGFSAHGASDMPTWGSLFQVLDKNDERVVRQRIDNLCKYLASIQER